MKTIKIIVLVLVLLFCATNFVFAYGEKKASMSRAEGYAKVKMYNDAINELRQIIDESPTYANAHLLMGDCYLAINNPSEAGVAYERYLILKPGKRGEMAPKFMGIGDRLLSNNDFNGANQRYSQAIEINQSYRGAVADRFFQAGNNFMYRGDVDRAENLFNLAKSYNPSISTKIRQAQEGFGAKMIAEAKTKPKNERERYIALAKRYAGQDAVNKAFPPPKWITVFKKEYIGRGMGENDIIAGMPYVEKEIVYGDKIIIKGKKFKFLKDIWGDYEDKLEALCSIKLEKPDYIGVRAPAGEKIVIEVQRLVD